MYSITEIGSWRVHIEYVGMEDMTEFTSSSLPAWDRKFEVAVSLLSTLLMMNPKCSTLGLVVPIHSPSYVKGYSSLHPKTPASWWAFSGGRFKGAKQDFFIVDSKSNWLWERSNSPLRVKSSNLEASMMRMVSYAYCIIGYWAVS